MERKNAETTWTWADQISSYRFWGLIFYCILTMGSFSIYLGTILPFLTEVIGLNPASIGKLLIIRPIASLYGLLLAWIAVRAKKQYLLHIFSALIIISLALIFLMWSYVTMIFAEIFIAMGMGAIFILIPSIIAGGRKGSEMFVVSFGILILLSNLSQMSASALAGYSRLISNPTYQFLVCAGPVVLGILFLIPVNPELFSGAPPVRGKKLQPQNRSPVLDAVLCCFIPFYYLYWLYRIHGEIASINNSPKLLSPRASVWSTLFIPLIFPVVMATLNDCLNESYDSGKEKYKRPTAHIVLWCIFFYPVSVAMIQSDINRVNQK